MNRKTIFAGLLSILISACASHDTASQSFQKEITGFASPESVTGDGHFIYVSNVGEKLQPQTKDGDGFISKLSPEGELIEKKFLPLYGKLNAPKGLIILDNTLYTADIDRIVGYDLKTKKKIKEIDFSSEGTAFLNAFASYNDHILFVSATDIGRIFRVNVNTSSYSLLKLPVIKGANGLFYDADMQRLLVVGFGSDNQPNGQTGIIELANDEYTYRPIPGKTGFLDGIVCIGKEQYLLSDWVAFGSPGALWRLDAAHAAFSVFPLPWKVNGPADIWFDTKRQLLYIPAMPDGKLFICKP